MITGCPVLIWTHTCEDEWLFYLFENCTYFNNNIVEIMHIVKIMHIVEIMQF